MDDWLLSVSEFALHSPFQVFSLPDVAEEVAARRAVLLKRVFRLMHIGVLNILLGERMPVKVQIEEISCSIDESILKTVDRSLCMLC